MRVSISVSKVPLFIARKSPVDSDLARDRLRSSNEARVNDIVLCRIARAGVWHSEGAA